MSEDTEKKPTKNTLPTRRNECPKLNSIGMQAVLKHNLFECFLIV
jgi:hypothetical protein